MIANHCIENVVLALIFISNRSCIYPRSRTWKSHFRHEEKTPNTFFFLAFSPIHKEICPVPSPLPICDG